MAREISNSDDVIDSRDVIARIAELDGERQDLLDALEAAEDEIEKAERQSDLDEWDGREERLALLALAAEGESVTDWVAGAALVRDSYFEDYAQELVEDIGHMPDGFPSYIEIDWEATARNIRQDYSSIDFDGVTYWVRS